MKRNQATFVTPVKPAPDVAMIEQSPQRLFASSVRAEWMQNFGGGIGAAVLVVALWLTLHGAGHTSGIFVAPWPDGWQVAIGASIVGAYVFGTLMVMRSSIDEIVETIDWQHAMSDLDAQAKEIEELRMKLDAANVRVKQAENQMMVQAANMANTNRTRVDPTPIKSDIWLASENMIDRKFKGHKWTRDAMMAAGWSKQKWADTMDHLTRAGLVTKNGTAYEPVFGTVDEMFAGLYDYERRIGEARKAASIRPSGMSDEPNGDVDEWTDE